MWIQSNQMFPSICQCSDSSEKHITKYLSLCYTSLCVGSYWGSINWRQWPKLPSRTSWRGGDVWSIRENRISLYHCCLNTQLVRTTQKILPLMLIASTGPSEINSITCSESKLLNRVQITASIWAVYIYPISELFNLFQLGLALTCHCRLVTCCQACM